MVQHALTIPEGLTSEQIVARLLENDILAGQVKEIPREGTLLPETYRFERGTTREQVIQRMQQAQRRLLAEIWERRSPDVPIRSVEQLVTLASIVEKETGRPDERTRVAAVFANRLQKKMKLQSDPTIIYGLVGGKGTLGRQIKRSEIQQPTPYNTYAIEGLPPGPIANPGRASLEATANPARTRELYLRRRRHRRTHLHRDLRRASAQRREAAHASRSSRRSIRPSRKRPRQPRRRIRAATRLTPGAAGSQAGRRSETAARRRHGRRRRRRIPRRPHRRATLIVKLAGPVCGAGNDGRSC